MPWAKGYASKSVASCPLDRPVKVYFNLNGSDLTGDGSIGNPFLSLAKANAVIGGSNGNIAVLFARGQTFRSLNGLIVSRPNVTVSSYAASPAQAAFPAPRFTRFEPPVQPSDWAVDALDPTVASIVAPSPMAWVRYENDVSNVFLRVLSEIDLRQTAGSWYHDGLRLWVHLHDGRVFGSSAAKIEFVYKNVGSGIRVLDVNGVRINGLQIDGYGAGTPGDHSYRGYGIEGNQSLGNRLVVTDCEVTYNGRHNIGKVTDFEAGGSLVVRGCRLGWMVNDDLSLVSYSYSGRQELVAAGNEILGGALPNTTRPYAFAGSGQSILLHTTDDSVYIHGFFLAIANRAVPGPFQCGTVSGSGCAPQTVELSDQRSFVINEESLSRRPNALDLTSPSSSGSDGLINPKLGSKGTVYIGCRVECGALWGASTGDRAILTEAHGIWINSVVSFDFRNFPTSANSRALTLSPVDPIKRENFTASFYGCRLTAYAPVGGTFGISGPMVHQYGTYRNSLNGGWLGQLTHSSIVCEGNRGSGRYVAFSNDGVNQVFNSYAGFTETTGAWGIDRDPGASTAETNGLLPTEDTIARANAPIMMLGRALEYDMNGQTRPQRPAIGPFEPPPNVSSKPPAQGG